MKRCRGSFNGASCGSGRTILSLIIFWLLRWSRDEQTSCSFELISDWLAAVLRRIASTCAPDILSSSLSDKHCQIFGSLCPLPRILSPDSVLPALTLFLSPTTAFCSVAGFANLTASVTLPCCLLMITLRSRNSVS
ncbi:hypothetical protein CHARACLAT_009518 [Characodon lateralis]|uniref:Secreted protein n=1 Tax=Characodon lateralis TaxID=208331 RepID=A0ABU7EA71_9TELE|nr:hypothetical protein [Characodon lateralis]